MREISESAGLPAADSLSAAPVSGSPADTSVSGSPAAFAAPGSPSVAPAGGSPADDRVREPLPADVPRDFTPEDTAFMREALAEASRAAAMDEVPVGAVIVRGGQVIARAANTRETSRCATHHAEILAIEEACRALGGWRLSGATLYVTLEPCPMCAGAIANARIARVVFGAYDPKAGAYGSLFDLNALPLNHHPAVTGGCLAPECREVLTSYFRAKRKKETP